jgi:hypothetical protein
VDEQFEYADAGGRLSKLVTSAGNGGLALSASQTFNYGNLGVVTTHGHPRSTGVFPVVSTYTNGLLTALSGNGANVVTAATYNPAAGLASWTASVRRAGRDDHRPGRDHADASASIANSLWSTGTYTYDGAGNILKVGTGDAFTYTPLRPRRSTARAAHFRLRPVREPHPERRNDHDRPGPQPGDRDRRPTTRAAT